MIKANIEISIILHSIQKNKNKNKQDGHHTVLCLALKLGEAFFYGKGEVRIKY